MLPKYLYVYLIEVLIMCLFERVYALNTLYNIHKRS